MGVFDFIRDAGAKVGLGDSTKEIQAKEEAAKAAAAAKDAAADAAAEAAAAAERAKNEAEGKARIEMAQKRREAAEDAAAKEATAAKKQKRAARIAERKAEGAKSRQLEKYVADLGLHAEDLDIRFDDGVAFVEGTVASQADRERIILAVGNVAGVEKVDEDIDVVEPEPEAQMYTVVKGDTLSKIAKEFYGDASSYPTIFEANRPMLKDPDLIYPGQVLRIPAA